MRLEKIKNNWMLLNLAIYHHNLRLIFSLFLWFLLCLSLDSLLPLLLLFEIHWQCQQVAELLSNDLVVGLEPRSVERQVSWQKYCSVRQHGDVGLPVGNEFAFFFFDDVERLDELMVETVLDSDSGRRLVFECAQRERQRRVLCVDLLQEVSGFVGPEQVSVFDGSLENGSSWFALLRPARASADKDLESEHVADVELVLFGLGVSDRARNHVVAVDDMFLEFVRKHSFNNSALVLFGGLADDFSDLRVLVAWQYRSERSFFGSVCGQHDVGDSVFDLCGRVGSHINGMARDRNISVDVDSQIDFSDIAFFELGAFVFERRKVADDVVDRNRGRERNASSEFLGLLAVKDFLRLFFDVVVTFFA